MRASDFEGKSLSELRQIASAVGVKWHPRAKEAKLIGDIIKMAGVQQKPNPKPEMLHKAEQPTEAKTNSQADIENAVKGLMAKDGFSVQFPRDGTVIFKCKGCEDSLHMSVPLRVIAQRAESVSRGRRAPRSMGTDQTYPGSYADNILAG